MKITRPATNLAVETPRSTGSGEAFGSKETGVEMGNMIRTFRCS